MYFFFPSCSSSYYHHTFRDTLHYTPRAVTRSQLFLLFHLYLFRPSLSSPQRHASDRLLFIFFSVPIPSFRSRTRKWQIVRQPNLPCLHALLSGADGLGRIFLSTLYACAQTGPPVSSQTGLSSIPNRSGNTSPVLSFVTQRRYGSLGSLAYIHVIQGEMVGGAMYTPIVWLVDGSKCIVWRKIDLYIFFREWNTLGDSKEEYSYLYQFSTQI